MKTEAHGLFTHIWFPQWCHAGATADTGRSPAKDGGDWKKNACKISEKHVFAGSSKEGSFIYVIIYHAFWGLVSFLI